MTAEVGVKVASLRSGRDARGKQAAATARRPCRLLAARMVRPATRDLRYSVGEPWRQD